MTKLRLILLYLPFTTLLVASSGTTKPASGAKSTGAEAVVAFVNDLPGTSARRVAYGQNEVVAVKTKLRYTTLIILPKNENILDFVCGDKDYWVVNGSNNFAYIKPARAGAQTNLNLVTASGNIYSFVLEEVSGTKAAPDLKLFVELKDDAMLAASKAAPRFVTVSELDTYKDQLDKARQDMRQAKDGEDHAIQQGINRFVSNVRFAYRFEAGKKPFNVRAM